MVILHFKQGGQVDSEIFSPQTAQVDGHSELVQRLRKPWGLGGQVSGRSRLFY